MRNKYEYSRIEILFAQGEGNVLNRAQLRRKITTDEKNVLPTSKIIRIFNEGQDLSLINLVFTLPTLAAGHLWRETYWCVDPIAFVIAVSSILWTVDGSCDFINWQIT